MLDKFINLKVVKLKNNCPECYSNEDLHLTFKQRFVETTFYKSITPEIKHQIECKNCNSIIYPVQWTEDIELVFKYHHKALVPKKNATYLKKTSWVSIGVLSFIFIALIIAIIYYNL